MNKFDWVLCAIFFNIYLVVCWVFPLNVTDGLDNRWLNVLFIHAGFALAIGFCWVVGYTASKSNIFRG